MDINGATQPGLIHRVLGVSLNQRWLTLAGVGLLALLGVWNFQRLAIDAVPDITNVQVQINTQAPGYTPLEVEQRITFPIEVALAGLPHTTTSRSLSRYALSQITVIFEEGTDIYFARALVNERLQQANDQLPEGLRATLGPIASGLGEIFHYTVSAEEDARQANGNPYDATALRQLQDWVIRPQLRRVPGVTEVNTIGGYAQEFHVTPQPARLLAYGLSLPDLVDAIARNSANQGAGYLEHGGEQWLIRAPGQLADVEALANLIVAQREGQAIRLNQVADVGIGKELRTGAATRDGQETVLGTAVMLLGSDSRAVSAAVADKLASINRSLPAGVRAQAVYDRTRLVDKTLSTVQKNLLEGALLVVLVLLLMLGNLRAALITAAIIPLSMLLLISGMVQTRTSANLMSLGALDFGLIVDGSLIIVEHCLRKLGDQQAQLHRRLRLHERLAVVQQASADVFLPSLLSVLVVILVNLPLLALTGVEGKMFIPMAATVIMALLAALLLSVTFVPVALALILTGDIKSQEHRALRWLQQKYLAGLHRAMAWRLPLVMATLSLLIACAWLASRMGTEFIPQLDEGDLAVQALRIPGTSLTQSIAMQQRLEQALQTLPQVETSFARIGTAEVASDPMGPNIADGYVMLKDRSLWPDPTLSKAQLVGALEALLAEQPGNAFEISQPIELRFNELISGVRSALGVKIYGDDLDQLRRLGDAVAESIRQVPGATDVKIEQTSGLPLLSVDVKRAELQRLGLSLAQLQRQLAAATGGETAGTVYQGDQRLPIVVRLPERQRNDPQALARLPIALPSGGYVPLQEVATLSVAPGINQISREDGKRRLVVSANVSGRDLGGFVHAVQARLADQVSLPAGYWLGYGGTFEQMAAAATRLSILVPLTLLLIFGLLMAAFQSAKDALIVFSGVPLALTGGIIALWLRDLPLSITAGVGFITLSGVAVLTGVVLMTAIRAARAQGNGIDNALFLAAGQSFRPIVTVALVAALGFLPMALNTSTGAEVQRPLATVVIGGIFSATLLSLWVLPALYQLAYRKRAQ